MLMNGINWSTPWKTALDTGINPSLFAFTTPNIPRKVPAKPITQLKHIIKINSIIFT